MTIEELVEEMEENEDTVECTWCNELYGKDQCRYEVDLGWLCGRCEAAIKSRGETLTFRENNYWDFLDEDFDVEYSEADVKAIATDIVDSAKALLQDSPISDDTLVEETLDVGDRELWKGSKSWVERVKEWFSLKVINLFIKNKKLYDLVCDSLDGHIVKDALAELIHELQQCDFDLIEQQAIEDANKKGISTDGLALKVFAKEYFIGGYREEVLVDRLLTRVRDGKAKDIFEAVKQLDAEMFEYDLVPESELNEEVEDTVAVHDLGNEYDGGYPAEVSKLAELEDTDNYKKRLTICPECGDKSFDYETGFCIHCGFNL
jgi:hypothetical protein